jgi:hypothetical protein
MLKFKMKTALQIILAKIMEAIAFHRTHAFASGDELTEAWNKYYGS